MVKRGLELAAEFANRGMELGFIFASRGMELGFEFASRGEEVGPMAKRGAVHGYPDRRDGRSHREMADRILSMSDRIAEFGNKIVYVSQLVIYTEQLIVNVSTFITETIRIVSDLILSLVALGSGNETYLERRIEYMKASQALPLSMRT